MTSPSTLIRKAAKTKNKVLARKLRAEAAQLRRDIRAAHRPAWVPARIPPRPPIQNSIERTIDGIAEAAQRGAIAGAGQDTAEQPLISESEIQHLHKLAHPRKNLQEFETALRAQIIDAKTRGRRSADDETARRLQSIYEINRINVVSALLCEVAHVERHGKPLPKTWILSGYTLARVVEALREAGYTEEGKNAPRRP